MIVDTALRQFYNSPFKHELQIRLCVKVDGKWYELQYADNAQFQNDVIRCVINKKLIAVIYYGRMLYACITDNVANGAAKPQQLPDYAQRSISKQLPKNNL